MGETQTNILAQHLALLRVGLNQCAYVSKHELVQKSKGSSTIPQEPMK